MKEKTMEFLKRYLIGFILGFVSVGIVAVYADTYFPSNDVTYDNSESGLKSSDVQGAIDELYGVCFPSAGDQVIEDAGLEKDPYECRYFFTGADPNNYITFNNETAGWRIMSVECDGTIKIMRKESIRKMVWDGFSSNWARPSIINTYLNETYYNELDTTAQSQIVAKDFSIGAVVDGNDNLADQINYENGTKWSGKVALPTLSEYIRSNSNKSSCGTFRLYDDNYSSSCRNTTWMYTSNTFLTLTPESGVSYRLYAIVYLGYIQATDTGTDSNIYPVVYLNSDITLIGDGSQSNPYTIE